MKKSSVKSKSTASTRSKSMPKDKPATNPLTSKPKAPSGDGARKEEAFGPSVDADERLQSQEEKYRQQCEEAEMPKIMSRPIRISLQLIARRNLSPDVASGSHEKLIHAISKLTHLRLDRENVGEIDDLEMMGPVTNLYLQQNRIEKIKNLESLQSLCFLTLAGNQIEKVENLTDLPGLKLLDLSSNQIQEFDTNELPKTLMILTMEGNPCCKMADYRRKLLLALPNLQQLDGDAVTRQERLEAGCDALALSSEEDDEMGDVEDEVEGRTGELTEDILQLSANLIKESRLRSQRQASEHYRHMGQLVEARSQSQLAMNSARSSLGMTPRSGDATSAPASGRLSAGSSASR
ncbi:leucine-rich repeat-containing protein 46-like [Acanthaster planci]|uniref:Leucine-rich repeat-containing protein 46-like n=1 Tax=Acanthaster planci TaxID=133434 RepID=A0A8B7XH99_ACAPL|nr:leucine-rich repeat-containing protein 46-like [Acanthaster planci]XP_022080174.1 leucine-rich repeat-containing protein 46-like [Acanthaster planci]